MSKNDIPVFTYKLQQPIKCKLFNHKKFPESFDLNSFIQNETIYRSLTWSHFICRCTNFILINLGN